MTYRIPLLKDHHSHPYLYATLGNSLDISTVTDKDSATSLIQKRLASEDLLVVTGWYNNRFAFADSDLDTFPPLIIFNVSLHTMFMNAAARKIFKAAFPELVENYRNGGWVERNASTVLGFMVQAKPCDVECLRSYFSDLARLGVWHAEEMSLQDEAGIELFEHAGLLGRTRFWTSLDTYNAMSDEGRNRVHGIKVFADGALGAKTALLDDPYVTGEKGVKVWSDDEFGNIIHRCSHTGKALAVHAIGNAAISQLLAVLEKAQDARLRFPEIRMEHCQFISTETALKAKKMGIKLCLQPNFSQDSIHYSDRLPESYRLRNNPLRMLIDEAGYVPGTDLIFGSDGMPHGVRPALESALFPPLDGQRLTLDEFVAGYCMPDISIGHIEISINYKQKKLDADVMLSE